MVLASTFMPCSSVKHGLRLLGGRGSLATDDSAAASCQTDSQGVRWQFK